MEENKSKRPNAKKHHKQQSNSPAKKGNRPSKGSPAEPLHEVKLASQDRMAISDETAAKVIQALQGTTVQAIRLPDSTESMIKAVPEAAVTALLNKIPDLAHFGEALVCLLKLYKLESEKKASSEADTAKAAELEQKKSELEELEHKNAEVEKERNGLAAKLAAKEAELKQKEEAIGVLRDQVSGKDRTISEQMDELKRKSDELNIRVAKIKELNQKLDKLSEDKAKLESQNEELESQQKSSNKISTTMEHALNGASAAFVGAVKDSIDELERTLAMARQRKNPQKGDLNAIMTKVCDLRSALKQIELGGGYSIEISPCIDDETVWQKQSPIPFDDDCQTGGEIGQQVVVHTRGYRYVDALGEERVIKAKVAPVISAKEDAAEETSEVSIGE